MSTVKHGDKYPIMFTVNMDLTGWAVRLLYKGASAGVLASEVTDPAGGVITHILTGELEVGAYRVEVEASRSGEVVTFPSDGYGRLVVSPDLG